MSTTEPPQFPDLDPQDPLPEPQWTWRRLYTYVLTLLSCAGVGLIVCRAPAEDLKDIALALISLVVVIATLYLVAPSAEQIAKIIGAWRRK